MKKVLFILVTFLLVYCGSRKTETRKEKTDYTFENVKDTTAQTKESNNKSSEEKKVSVSDFSELKIEYLGKEGDSIAIYNIGANNEILSGVIFKGSGKINITSGEAKNKTNTVSKGTESTKKEKVASGTTKVSGKLKKSVKEKETDANRSSLWWFLLLLLIPLYFLNKRFNILSRIKNTLQNKLPTI